MKLEVDSFLLLPQALLPPCFLEIRIWILRPRVTACAASGRENKFAVHFKNFLLSCGPKVSKEKAGKFVLQWDSRASWISTGCLNTVTKLSEGHWKRDIPSPSHFSFCEATHNTKLIKASTLRKRNVPFGKFRNSWLVLSITFVLTSVELIQLSLFMKLSFLCYLIATNCCNYISELQIFCTDKNFDCLSATHKEKITSAKWGVPRLDNNA